MAYQESRQDREQQAAEDYERDKAWYDKQRAEAREVADQAGKLADTLLWHLGDSPYEQLNKQGQIARISPFVELPTTKPDGISTMYGRVFIVHNSRLTEDRRRHLIRPRAVVAGDLSEVGVHYYSRPDDRSYRGVTAKWDGSVRGSVADARLTLGVLESLADMLHVQHPKPADEPESTL